MIVQGQTGCPDRTGQRCGTKTAGRYGSGEGKILCPLRLFLTIDPGWTEGQWARDRCIRVDIAAETESWGQDWEDAETEMGEEMQKVGWSFGSPGKRDEPEKSTLG